MLAERIRYLRKKRKLTMKELGAKFGLAESTISGYESNIRKPDLDTLEKLADFFDVSVDYLLGRTDSPFFSRDEENFLNDIDLSLEVLKEKYNLTLDGQTATDEELNGMIAWIKVNRMIKGEN